MGITIILSRYHSMKKSNSKTTKIIATIIIMALCTTLAITIALFGPKEVKQAFFVRSIGEAADSCEQEVVNNYGERLISKHYDEISSRYEPNYKQYTVFYRISFTTMENNLPTVQSAMVKCIVWERLGYVSDFTLIKQ